MAISFSRTAEGDIVQDHHLIASVLGEALPYIDFLKGKTLVIKLGGSTLEHQKSVLQDIIWLRALGAYPVLVHGGGPYINEWLTRMNIPTHFEKGLRVTDAATLEIVRMVLLGQVNQGLVLMASQLGGKAIGLCGTDGGMVHAHIADASLGFVGEIDSIDPTPIEAVIKEGYIPIIAPLGEDTGGTCLNINADLVAAHIAGSMNAEKLIFLSNVTGICQRDGTLIQQLREQDARRLIDEGVIRGGMIPKVTACLDALAAVPRVHIVDGREQHVLLRELFTDKGAGTMILRS
ncbi:acetylglutamate kinase [Ktedonobacteria bacterium brp13]|nr:acetylglutamate kinase [Ktedonobacteria bacterium brp13]